MCQINTDPMKSQVSSYYYYFKIILNFKLLNVAIVLYYIDLLVFLISKIYDN